MRDRDRKKSRNGIRRRAPQPKVLDNERKHKKVFITEVGYSDTGKGEETAAANVIAMLTAIRDRMPYVETVNIFKLYDVGKKNNWDSVDEVRFGLVHDPDTSRTYYKLDIEKNSINVAEDGRCIPGAPKNKAYEYQRLAGGTGSLEVLMSK